MYANLYRAIAGGGAVLYKIKGNHHPFSVEDISISYPLQSNTVSITVVGIIAFLAPAITIAVLSLALPPSHSLPQGASKSIVWRSKFWAWHAGWLGLGLSLATTLFVTSALKDIVGKPRPDLLARCDPDISNINAHVVSGLGLVIEEAPVMVDIGICRNTDQSVLYDGFASFPSGHSSFAWAGLFYLSLWLCARFAVTIPFLPPRRFQNPLSNSISADRSQMRFFARDQAAAPPLFSLALVSVPTAAAIYVCATRWSDNQHHGFDIISGSLIGFAFAWLSFRWYNPPIRRGIRSAWGPRSWQQAFSTGSKSTYLHDGGHWLDENRHSQVHDSQTDNMELGHMGAHIRNEDSQV